MDQVFHVKNMVCYRCILAVETILRELNLPFKEVRMGEMHFLSPIDKVQKYQLMQRLALIGLEIIDTRLNQLVEKAKKLIILKARNEVAENEKGHKLSYYLSENLALDYSYLSSLFSMLEGRTIEKYFIEHRIEKAKELLVYDQLSLSEISYALNYSSVSHLSAQFKKTTGLTASHFKEIGDSRLKGIDEV